MAADALDSLHPLAAAWFRATYGTPTRAQQLAWPTIQRGESTLLLAPTGSGKTLAAFFVAISRLALSEPRLPGSRPATRVLYVSPLKALGVDVERNLRQPLLGLCAAAEHAGLVPSVPTLGVRSGDTEAKMRVALTRSPPDILITTPESLYLMLTSQARHTLTQVQCVIIDEIHALCATKRGSHLMLSLERLEALRSAGQLPLQRIGLSATQRPLDVVARFLGGGCVREGKFVPRPVTLVDAGRSKRFELSVQMPRQTQGAATPPEAAPLTDSLWPQIHARVLQLIRAHRSTMIFVNSRRLSERFAGAVNELAGAEVALVHHGSVAKETRALIEDRLKQGHLPAIVATSSLELGIDMGAVDLVVQVEAPPSVASALQRIGRAGHQVGLASRGVFFPRYAGELLACAAVVKDALQGQVEATHYPNNPLDVLAQQVVSILVTGAMSADALFDLVRGAAAFADLPRELFEGVLDMLSGHYPSPRLAALAARINYDRSTGMLEARRGARLLALSNAGTIVDRGLYAVYLSGVTPVVRVGELDEEMVFESRVGDVFLLGASSWRIDDISHDRVLVSPAPGQPGRMPFWRGGKPGRPLEFGRAIGALARQLEGFEPSAASEHLSREHHLEPSAADNLLDYLREQRLAAQVPTDRRIVVESFQDEIGQWRVAILSPFGGRVHAPWSALVVARLRAELGVEVDSVWTDDGIAFRLPELNAPPDVAWFTPAAETAEAELISVLAETSLFAAHFRENAARALLLPRRRPGRRLPLWIQRRRSADLLSVAREFADFPIVLETYRECLQDVFDLPGLLSVLTGIAAGEIELAACHTARPSPFAAALLFSYVANFLYAPDAPPAERRAQTLNLDHAQLQRLLGEPELRRLLDPEALLQVQRALQRLDQKWPLESADGVQDLLWQLGDLSVPQLRERCADPRLEAWLTQLAEQGRALQVQVAGEARWLAAQDAARYQAALGVELPAAFLGKASAGPEPLREVVLRYAATHGPFLESEVQQRFALTPAITERTLAELVLSGALLRGAFLPGGTQPEYCHRDVLGRIKQLSLVRLRREIEPVEPEVYVRFALDWQRVGRPARGYDGLLEAVERLQGTALPYTALLGDVLPARLENFQAHELDALCATGQVVWRGLRHGAADTKLMLFLSEAYPLLAPPVERVAGEQAQRVREWLATRGAVFFADLARALAVFPADLLGTLWEMVWAGEITNDTLAPLRSRAQQQATRGSTSAAAASRAVRSGLSAARWGAGNLGARSELKPGSEGRWSLLPEPAHVSATEQLAALAEQLLFGYGIVTRETVTAAGTPGGFAAVYPVFKALEEAGRVRRGYFIAGLGATQFALGGAESRLRALRSAKPGPLLKVSALDPANPYGAVLPWPEHPSARPSRALGSFVVLQGGQLLAHLSREQRHLLVYEPKAGSELEASAEALARFLLDDFALGTDRAWLIEQIDGQPAERWLSAFSARPFAAGVCQKLLDLGFRSGPKGFQLRRSELSPS